jgi:DNA-binding MarR family transcriptional regulator
MDDLASRMIRVLEEGERSQITQEMKEVLASLRSLADERLAIHQISYKQGVPLRYLNRRSSCNVTELAKAAGVDLGAMTRMLERLEAKGLLERRRSSTDRRVVYVSLLEAGATIAALVDDVLVSVAEDHLKDFALQERTRLRELLERMRVNGRALADG